jgi:hypothetical protein
MATHVIILNETIHPEYPAGGWQLCLQRVRYQYDMGDDPEEGFRFIWRREDGSLQAARGQARIPSLAYAELLIHRAREEGWGNLY